MWPCEARAANAATAGSTARRSRSIVATACTDGVRSDTTRQRDRIVTGTSSTVGAHSIQTVRSAGSSTDLSRASAAFSVSRSASSTTRIWCRPRTGDMAARWMSSRVSFTWRLTVSVLT